VSLHIVAGLHLGHRLPHILHPSELKLIHPRRRLRPYVAASPQQVAEQNDIDLYEAPADMRLVFFSTGVMQVYACNLLGADDHLELRAPDGARCSPLLFFP
jgi:hypothetical protein